MACGPNRAMCLCSVVQRHRACGVWMSRAVLWRPGRGRGACALRHRPLLL